MVLNMVGDGTGYYLALHMSWWGYGGFNYDLGWVRLLFGVTEVLWGFGRYNYGLS